MGSLRWVGRDGVWGGGGEGKRSVELESEGDGV